MSQPRDRYKREKAKRNKKQAPIDSEKGKQLSNSHKLFSGGTSMKDIGSWISDNLIPNTQAQNIEKLKKQRQAELKKQREENNSGD